jgi:acetyl-CoA carboxylase biotin carboxyl carrier protein
VSDGRITRRIIVALAADVDGGRVELRAPGVGLYRGGPAVGALVAPGSALGELETLGTLVEIVAPEDATGIVVELGAHAALARRPVGHGDRLVLLEPNVGGEAASRASAPSAASSSDGGLVMPSPSSGRYYARPSPGEPPFVSVGDIVTEGTTVALLEVMKTFNRIAYGGRGLPPRARVVRIVPTDEADLDTGDPILEIEPVS